MKHDNEERRWAMSRYADYSKPAYFYRLFHEGRPKPRVFDFQIDYTMPRYVLQELAGTSPILVPGSTVCRKHNDITSVDDFPHVIAAIGKVEVDPLDGVW